MNRFLTRFLRNRRNERGNTFVFYVLLVFPVAFICFALASDVAIAQYTKNTLQADLAAAAQSAVGQSLPSASLATNRALIRDAFVKIYAADRANYSGTKNAPFVLCQGRDIPFAASAGTNYTPADGCGWHEDAFVVQATRNENGIVYRNYVQITVTEYVKTMFLGVIGIKNFPIKITTTAHLAQSYYTR